LPAALHDAVFAEALSFHQELLHLRSTEGQLISTEEQNMKLNIIGEKIWNKSLTL
jgi:hypothetical protein